MSENPSTTAQDRTNLALYEKPGTVNDYTAIRVHPPEVTVLVRYREDIYGHRVLELGCGAGRLAAFLQPLAGDYIGLDFSSHMVRYCQNKYPALQFVQGDMRNLQQFGTHSFDTVIAVANLIDAVSHEDRLQVLAEAKRVLKPEGLFVFSAHNRNCTEGVGGPILRLTLNPVSQMRAVYDYLISLANHRRIKPQQRNETDYALLNDRAHNNSVLHYYTTRGTQEKQLEAAGFRCIECLNHSGDTLAPGADDSDCASMYFVARPIG